MIDSINLWLKGISLVEWGIITCFIFLTGLTALAAIHKQKTVSNSLKEWGHKHSWFAFLFGGLVGHWFYPNIGIVEREWMYLLIPMGGLGLFDYLTRTKRLNPPKFLRYSGLWVTLGIISGALLWSSNL